HKLLAKKPADRIQTAGAAAEALTEWLQQYKTAMQGGRKEGTSSSSPPSVSVPAPTARPQAVHEELTLAEETSETQAGASGGLTPVSLPASGSALVRANCDPPSKSDRRSSGKLPPLKSGNSQAHAAAEPVQADAPSPFFD